MKRLFILTLSIVLLGCEPSLEFDKKETPQAAIPSELAFTIRKNSASELPVARLFPKYDSTRTIRLDKQISELAENKYQIHLPALPQGDYRLVLSVPYYLKIAGFHLVRRHKTVTYDFAVHGKLPADCFNFDDKNKGLQGWTVRGVFVGGREKPANTGNCPGLFYVNHSWPHQLNETVKGGSLFVPVASNCFPKPGQQVSGETRWAFTLMSPKLENKQQWQQIKSVVLRMATKSIPVVVSPEVFYQIDENKSSTYFHEKLTPQYQLSGGHWEVIKHSFNLPKRAQITQLAIHVLGIPEKTIGDAVDSIFLDGVCPAQ